MRTKSMVLACTLLAWTNNGCSGSIPATGGDPAPEGGRGTGGRGGSGSPRGGGGGTAAQDPSDPAPPPPVQQAASCPPGGPVIGPSTLRRLSPTEYRNTVRDLLTGVTIPAIDLPPDQVVETEGFDNDAAAQTPSPLLIDKYHRTALALADAAFKSKRTFLPCTPAAAADEATCGARVVRELGLRAFRRPLTTAEVTQYTGFFEGLRQTGGFNVAAQLLLQAFLESPAFIYKLETSGQADSAGKVALSSYEVASRLSYLVWQSMPDETLLTAAAANKLTTADDVEQQARRMLADPRARTTMGDFNRQWLGFDALATTTKDAKLFPSWNDALRTSLVNEAAKSLDDAVFRDGASLDTLMTSTRTFVTPALAAVYGVPAPANAAGDWVSLDAQKRSGFLTQAWWLSGLAHPTETSPVKRGKFVLQKLLCTPPAPPTGDVNLTPPAVTPGDGKSVRQRLVEQHEVKPTCAACHKIIDGIGFGFEGYDSMGRLQATDNGQPVDDSGNVMADSDVDGAFKGGVELAKKLAASDQVRRCVGRQWFRFAWGRAEAEPDACALSALDRSFAAAKYNLPELLVATARSDAFRFRTTSR